jgi:nitrite reductase/ring-hydroxylating ferredoxin subunit/uncharacterized membrane protein
VSEQLVDRIVRSQKWLDPLGGFIQKAITAIYRPLGRPGKWLQSALHGSILLGHALHPVLTDVPVGAWTVTIVLDVLAHFTSAVPHVAGDAAALLGVVAALAAVLTGYNDFHYTYGQERRVATAHGVLMTLVTILYLASVGLRFLAGPSVHGTAVWISVAGYVVMTVGAYFGGHLTFGIGTMINRNAFTEAPSKFTAVGTSQDFREGELNKVHAGDMAVLMVRRNGTLLAIGNTCSHAGGPLNEGKLEGDVIECPWHGSKFCVRNGNVKSGPATFPQPLFDVRESGGTVEVSLLAPRHK